MPREIKTQDIIFAEILQAYRNADANADISQGSVLYIKGFGLAQAVYGEFVYDKWVADQAFPDSSDEPELERHAFLDSVTRKDGESAEDLLSRLISTLQNPESGGTAPDFKNWAETVQGVRRAYVFDGVQGIGSVDVVIEADEFTATGTGTIDSTGTAVTGTGTVFTSDLRSGDKIFANDEERIIESITDDTNLVLAEGFTSDLSGEQLVYKSIIPRETLLDAVVDEIDGRRPVGVSALIEVLAPTIQVEDISINLVGGEADADRTKLGAEGYLNSLSPGETMFVSQLIVIGTDNGADSVSVTLSTDIVPNIGGDKAPYQMIRPGSITVAAGS